MKVKKYNLWICANVALFLAINLFLRKGMFSAGDSDGFFIDIMATKDFSWGAMQYLLELVHVVRFVVAYPFLWMFEHNIHPVFESMLLMVFMVPVLFAEFGGRRRYSQALFVFLPLFISYRSVMVACAIAYLFIILYSEKKSTTMMWVSALLANLSSGVVLGWLLIVLSNYRFFRKKTVQLWLITVCMFLSLGFSLSQKIEFFSDSARTTGASNGAVEAFERNTLIFSYENHQYARLAVYTVAVFLLSLIFFHSLLRKRPLRSSSFFYYCAIPGLFLEGLSVMAFVIPIGWFFLGIRPRASTATGTDG